MKIKIKSNNQTIPENFLFTKRKKCCIFLNQKMTAAVPDSVQPMRAAVHEIFRRKDSDYEERK